MITLDHVLIRNFRNIEDIEFDFSTSVEKPLTLILANAGVGKTSLFSAIAWVFLGANAFDVSSRHERLCIFPKDLDHRTNINDAHSKVELTITYSNNGERRVFRLSRVIDIAMLSRVEFFETVNGILSVYEETDSRMHFLRNPPDFLESELALGNLGASLFLANDSWLSTIYGSDVESQTRLIERIRFELSRSGSNLTEFERVLNQYFGRLLDRGSTPLQLSVSTEYEICVSSGNRGAFDINALSPGVRTLINACLALSMRNLLGSPVPLIADNPFIHILPETRSPLLIEIVSVSSQQILFTRQYDAFLNFSPEVLSKVGKSYKLARDETNQKLTISEI